jgi:hypothetical protein
MKSIKLGRCDLASSRRSRAQQLKTRLSKLSRGTQTKYVRALGPPGTFGLRVRSVEPPLCLTLVWLQLAAGRR